MHVAEKHLELVGEEPLRLKKEYQDRQLAPASSELSGGRVIIRPGQIHLSESPAIESTSHLS